MLSCISINNQECKVRPQIVNIKGDDPVFPFSIQTSKCSGHCNNTYNPCAKLCVADVVKNLNVTVFDLVTGTNETSHIEWHETCKCKCRFNSSVSNNKQCWNDDKCRCEWKELFDKGECDEGFIWNPNNCECECYIYMLMLLSEYLYYKNYKCKKRLVNKLVEECTENIDETRLVEINLTECNSVENKCKYNSCTQYFVLFSIIFTVNIWIGSYFLCFYWYLRKDVICVKFGTHTQTTI